MTHLSPQLEFELRRAWTNAASTGVNAGTPAAEAYARSELLYEVAQFVFDESTANGLPAAPGEWQSIGEVIDAAAQHNRRAWRVLNGDETSFDSTRVSRDATVS